jgi:RecA-family ATPase
MGKSVAARQIAVAAAAGLHPFAEKRFPPQRVLYIDCENAERLVRRKFRTMIDQTTAMGRRHEHGMLRIILRPAGVALETPEGADWLLEQVRLHEPQLLILGPLYKLHRASANEDVVNRQVLETLDGARSVSGSAIILEAHAGHAQGELSRRRSVRPRGSSMLLGWPEFGYGLQVPDDQVNSKAPTHVFVRNWRGDRDEREWPTALLRSQTGFPWEPVDADVLDSMK